ncbi:DUF2254 domain-containing protein [Metabacillus indicus]|uniref:DUF2254 domain-containing protein n=1 Tax=Metabacillus indicus TaxID=246786 RepID=UPI000AE760D1|nr:DUF2254 domain-containing protein [Metabacillus indicus]
MPLKPALVKVKSNFWITPAAYAVLFFILAILSMSADRFLAARGYFSYVPSIFLTDKELSHTILSATSTSLLTMTTITFSSVLVVLTTFLANFSPRTMHNFNTDSKIQRVLGVFVGGYIYSLVLLNQVRENETSNDFIVPTLAILVAFLCVGMFVFLIHHMTEWIKVGNVISNITKETLASIDDKKRPEEKRTEKEPSFEDGIEVKSEHEGYIEDIAVDELVSFAAKHGAAVKFHRDQGAYADEDIPLLTLISDNKEIRPEDVLKYITFNADHESKNDIEFGIQKLAEIALRGIAPGKNDPETAIACIEHLTQILIKIGKHHSPSPYHRDSEGKIRVILPKPDFHDYLYTSFYQIRHYGKEDVSVMASILKALILIAETNREEIKEDIWSFSQYIYEGLDTIDWLSLDKKHLNRELASLALACGKNDRSLQL